ncbi:MAG: AAA family ATPase [Hyphomonadaceae bacterium]|nr:AAA family ATPase [Hyphomonadaceae bacterium]
MFVKAFRLFVSSTFQDFGVERRLLQEQVFPALEARCAAQGFGFRAVDMRWGVNDDAQLNQRTAEICLGEVIEAKGYAAPNLLILLGDRYGWVPLPFAIARDEFAGLRGWLLAQSKSEAVADLDRVYALNENHLVPGGLTTASADWIGAFTLRSREDDLLDLRAPEAWASVESRLSNALQIAARHLQANGQLRHAELEKYTLSLTEQEIRTGLEKVAGDGAAASNAIAWVRTTEVSEPAVRTLADAVQRALPEGHALLADVPFEYEGYSKSFVERITAKLIAAVDAQIAGFKARESAPDFALQTERAVHHAFAAERLRVFVGRGNNLAAIAAHITSEARHPLVLTGISGSGKTALMARAAAAAKGPVLQRFVGASAASANQRDLLISVIEDLVALGVASMPARWEGDDNRFFRQVRDLLSALDQPVVIFIDALDQLRAPYRPMWLPPELHPNVKLILSVLDDEAFAAERSIVHGLRRSLPAVAFIEIEALSERDGADILACLQRDTQRGLTPDQQALIQERFAAAGASPLYLRIAFAIARHWRSTDDVRGCRLAGNVRALIGQFLDELSSVHHHEPLLVRRALGLIAAGRHGLSEGELIAILYRDEELMAAVSSERFGTKADRLPDSVWVRLKRSLSALLVEKGVEGEPLITIFHRQVAEVVRARIYEPEKAALHESLSAYFDPPAPSSEADPPWTRRGFIELPFQLYHARMRERLDELFTDPVWIDRNIEALGRVNQIVADYERFENASDPLQPLIRRALSLAGGIIAREPSQRITQLHGRLLGVASQTFLDRLARRMPEGALHTLCPSLTPPGRETARLEGHRYWVNALAMLPDGRLASGAGDDSVRLWEITASGEEYTDLGPHRGNWTALAALPNGKLASALSNSIVIWDLSSERAIIRLEGHSETVMFLLPIPDGRLASASSDKTIRIWNVETGAEIARLSGHTSTVRALALLPDGRLASGSSDGSIRLWDLDNNSETACLRDAKSKGSVALAMLPDGRLASASGWGSIFVWDLFTGAISAELKGHRGAVMALLLMPDGRLASGGTDGTVRLWHVDAGQEAARFEGHDNRVEALALLPDGRLASASHDKTIRLWDVRACSAWQSHGHDGGPVRALALLPGGHLLSSGSGDHMIRSWDIRTRAETTRRLTDANSFAVLPDGRLAIGRFGTIELVDLTGTTAEKVLSGHNGKVIALASLQDGRLASAAEDGTIRLWDVTTGSETAQLQRRAQAIAELPDGLLACADNAISLVDLSSGKDVFQLHGHRAKVRALAVSPDGLLVSGSEDNSIQVWQLSTRSVIARLDIDAEVRSVVALPDRRYVVGDALGRMHWLAITGAEHFRTALDLHDPPAASVLHPPHSELMPRNRNGVRQWAAWLLLVALAIAAFFAGAVLWGVEFGFATRNDALAIVLSKIYR